MTMKITFASFGALIANGFSAALASGGALAGLSRSNSIVSFAETVSGALGPVTGEQLLIALAVLGGVGVQIVLVAAWRSFLREGDPLLLVMGLAMSMGSAALSSTTAVFFTHERMIERNLHTQATAPVVAALQGSSNMMRSVAASARALAVQASDLSRIENSDGGTCADVITDPGPGPRQRLRNRHAEAFADVSRRVNEASEAMFGNALDIVTADPEAAEAHYRAALSLLHSTEMRAIADELAALRNDVTDTFHDAQTDQRYSCQTPEFAASIARAEAELARALVTEIRDIRAPDAAVGDGFSLLADDLWAWITGKSADLPSGGRSTLAIILLIEAIQVAFLIADFRQRCRRAQETDAWGRFDEACNKLSAAKAARYERILAALDHLTLRTGGHLWLVHGEGSFSAAVRETVSYFGLDTDKAFAAGHIRVMPLHRLMPDWVAAREGLLEGEEFTLYRLPTGIDKWRRRARRDVHNHHAHHGAGRATAYGPAA